MYYYPYMPMVRKKNTPDNSYIRVLHAVPNAPNVDVYANGNLIVQDLAYRQFSPYVPVTPGNYNIEVYPTGKKENPVIDTDVYIPQGTFFNVAAIGELPNISLYPIPEPTTAQNFGRPCIRFVHLSPNAPAVDITLSDGRKIFSNISYKDITDYACIPSGTYTFQVRPSGTDDVVLTIPNVELMADNYYTIYAVGLAGETPPLQAIVASEPR
ncbi:DUF4397 domain-containing protein [Crassaminicella profunda]|uniref:DUF4397 domain-containing protein n=1 Tax=Crassaminicella profunda TaxID=1286698 RepID=UPI001CA5FBA8|nr:DUF4397 domain-containing protein [Crassaminicella profunda]QZY54512.1 DUF4397 domain-containing protein [Crassaminicella profunda]